MTDVEAFRAHYATTLRFTDDLKEGRCVRTAHFGTGLADTVAAFRPLFAPWNMEILFLVYMRGAMRFNALKRALDGVSSRVLTDKVRHMEAEGLLARRDDGDARVYALTERGRAVATLLHPIVFYLHNEPALPVSPAPPAA